MSHFDAQLPDSVDVRRDLQVCEQCRRPFVVPIAIVDAYQDGRFLMELGCNNCGATVMSVYDDDTLEDLDIELDRSMIALQEALDGMVMAEQLEQIDRFASALQADAILPEDF